MGNNYTKFTAAIYAYNTKIQFILSQGKLLCIKWTTDFIAATILVIIT
jgi:hypothetical protein